MNIAATMICAGEAFGAHPAVARGATIIRHYDEIADRVACIAAALINDHGLEAGDRVALIVQNCPEYIELLYAAWHAGLVVVPINSRLHPREFNFILANSEARLCFVSARQRVAIEQLTGNSLEATIAVGSKEYENMATGPPCAMVARQPNDAAWLFYTSGTTGQPKGAVLSHRNLSTMCECYFSDVDPVAPWKAILHAAPMSHGSGMYALAYVMKGGCHVIPQSAGFDVAEIYQLIEHWPGIAFFAAPTMVKRMLDYTERTNTDNLKVIIYGGGPMYVEDSLTALKRYGPKMTQLYGQGESPMTITALNAQVHADRDHPRWIERLGSVGVAQHAVEIRIADQQDRPLPIGEIGEILVRGDSVMNGYWNNPQATAETLRNGWLHTGDCGVLDENGFLTLKDREKDLIISGGSNIYPREVEEILLQHPGVSEVSVIGRPDPEWGEVVVAYLIGSDGLDIDAAAIDTYCKNEMSRFKRPRFYYQIERLPRNNYGKVLKTELRRIDQSRTA